jgi:hypothetical protein
MLLHKLFACVEYLDNVLNLPSSITKTSGISGSIPAHKTVLTI